jgi:hypothetical protein
VSIRAFVVTVAAAGLIVSLASAATAQDKRQRDEPGRKITRLWRLYPLDPESEERAKNANPPSQIPVERPTPAPEEASVSEPAAESPPIRDRDRAEPRGGVAGLIAGAVAFVGLAVFAGLLLLRRRGTVVPASRVPPRPTLSEGLPAAEPDQEPTEPRRVVRLQLKDGRVVKGRLRQPLSTDRPVLLIDVVDASDAEGRPSEPEPTDSFVPLAEVERIEGMEADEFLTRTMNGDLAGRHRSK